MFAIINSGGKQYKVTEGQMLKVERLNIEFGEKVSFPVLAVEKDNQFKIGTPHLEGCEVQATIVSHERDKKVIVFKKNRRKNYRRKKGHRQECSFILVTNIIVN